MPPRLATSVDDALTGAPLNPVDATMGQTSNGSNKRPRDEEDDLEDDDEEEGGKKERTFPNQRLWNLFTNLFSLQDERLKSLLSKISLAGISLSQNVKRVS